MTDFLATALILISLLLIKHLFADFFLQTARMMRDRAEYWHVGRMQHAGLHGGLSLICFVLIGAPMVFAVLVCVAEAIIHYHLDWAKGRYSDKTRFSPEDAGYWRAFGIDQLFHQLTYVAMTWMWAVWVA